MRDAQRRIRVASATDVPPNFWTMMPDTVQQDYGPHGSEAEALRGTRDRRLGLFDVEQRPEAGGDEDAQDVLGR
jgi:hypothetical protein